MNPEPATVSVRARDVRPYHYALWCSVAGGEPFANPIVHVKWGSDRSVCFMLGSFNFDFHEPDAVLELIPIVPTVSMAAQYGPGSAWLLGERPAVEVAP